jgi:hypothetical protein
MIAPETLALIDALIAEKDALDMRLDEALRAFADYEEQMNQRWHAADADQRIHLMTERTQVEESLGIVAIVERLDLIRDQIVRLRAV